MVVEVVIVAVAVGGRKPWLVICRKENLIAVVIIVTAMATVVTVVILALIVMEGLVTASPQL